MLGQQDPLPAGAAGSAPGSAPSSALTELCSYPFEPRPGLPGNILFVKTYKTGGSSWGGVMRRLGCRHGYAGVFGAGETLDQPEAHAVFANHASRRAVSARLALRPRPGAWLTILRDPAERCMSWVYWAGLSLPDSPRAPAAVEAKKLAMMRDAKCANSQAAQLETRAGQPVAELAAAYDFIAVTERFDESLLLLMNRWGLAVSDLLYLRSKDPEVAPYNASSRHGHRPEHTVAHAPLEQESRAVQRAYKALQQRNGRDAALLAIAHARLDAQRNTIEGFDDYLVAFRAMLATAEAECRAEFTPSSCMWGDNGCAQACINRVARERGWP